MAENSLIEWTDDTWNPWQGCRKVGIDCENCYMFRDKKRYGQDPLNIHRSTDRTFNLPLRLEAGRAVFVCSWSDFYIEEADAWRGDAWDIMRHRHDLVFIIPTKRPERIMANLPKDWHSGWRNVWHLLSAGNQETLDERMPSFIDIPGQKGLSLEPLVGAIGFANIEDLEKMDQVIVGGESGPNSRPIPTWAVRSLLYQCGDTCTPFYFKQWGEFVPESQQTKHLKSEEKAPFKTWQRRKVTVGDFPYLKVGKKLAGRLLDGQEHNELIWRQK